MISKYKNISLSTRDAEDRAYTIARYMPVAVAGLTQYRKKRYRSMNALETDWFSYMLMGKQVKARVFISYNTPVCVAIADPQESSLTLVEWRGYSRTTSKQTTAWTGDMYNFALTSSTIKEFEHITIEVEKGDY